MKYIFLLLLISTTARATSLDYLLNGISKPVKVDTAVPGNSVPYPFMYLDPLGARTALGTESTLQDVNTGILGIDTTIQGIDFATETTLSSLEQKVLTDAQLRAAPIDVLGPLTDVELRASPVPVDVTFPSSQEVTQGTSPWIVDGSGVTQPISAAALPLPLGASTEAKQDAAITQLTNLNAVDFATETTLNAINTKIPSLGQALKASSVPVTIASDQGPLQTTTTVNTNGSQSNTSLTGTTASTATVPANAVGFIIQAPDANTHTVRWRVGGVASTTDGMQLQPGRDSGFIPVAANVSVCATASGTNGFDIQWILSQ